jgi:hypothetical protein
MDEPPSRAPVAPEPVGGGLERTPEEVAHIAAERLAFERDLTTVRAILDPVLAPAAYARRLAAERR